jgi:hypothetical protein
VKPANNYRTCADTVAGSAAWNRRSPHYNRDDRASLKGAKASGNFCLMISGLH